MTLFGKTEQPTGYTTPQMYNYIAPAGTAYDVPDTTTSGANIALYFGVPGADNVGMMLNPAGTVTLSVITAYAAGVAQWTTATLDGATDTAGGGLWRQWTIEPNGAGGGYTAVATGNALATGNLGISGFPVVAGGSATEWYRIGVNTSTVEGSSTISVGKTIDLYTVTQNGLFDNPAYTSTDQKGSLAVDALAVIAPQSSTAQTIATFNVNLASGSNVVLDPSQMVVATSLLGN